MPPRMKEEEDNTDELVADLFDAISDGNTKLVAFLLKEAKKIQALLTRKDPQGLTPLRKSIALSKPDIARILVVNGASPDLRDPMGKTPLHLAVMQGKRELMAPLLVSVDSSVNVQDKSGWTPLHYAIRGKHLKVIEWLLYAGADVNLKNKNDESPLEVTEEASLMRKMLTAFNVDREIYPVTLASAFISRKELNYIGTDGVLMFVTTNNWSPFEQFFFCKKIRPSEASPLIPLRWNEFYYSDVYHYRTMRKLNPGQTRVKLYILFFENFQNSELVLKITSKDKFLGEVPLLRSTYIQETYTNFMGSCELDIKHEGQFVMVKRYVSIFLRKNEVGVYTCDKYADFLIDVPQGAVPSPPKEWNNTRLERAWKEKELLEKSAESVATAKSYTVLDYLQEFYEQTYTEEKGEADLTEDNSPELKQVRSSSSQNERRPSQDEEGQVQVTRASMDEDTLPDVQIEPMLEVHEPDDCDDFYYISRGWGVYLTIIRVFPLSLLVDLTTMEKVPIRCTSNFYSLSHTSEQSPSRDCTVQIPKSEHFTKIGTVLVFARKAKPPQNENPDPDDSPQEYLISSDMKTTWGQNWQNEEKERWSLIPTGIANKHSRVIFKTRSFTAFIVVQLSSGDERSEKEEEDDPSSSEEEEDTAAAEEEDGEKEDKVFSDDGDGTGAKEENEAKRKRSKKMKRRRGSIDSSIYGLHEDVCLQDEDEDEPEEEILDIGEGEGEGEAEDKPTGDSAEKGDVADGGAHTGEPEAPAPSPLPHKEETIKDENASNSVRQPSADATKRDNVNNNSSSSRHAALDNRNNNQIRDNDENMDQSNLSAEEKTIIVGPPPMHQEYGRLNSAPSVYRHRTLQLAAEDGPEKTETGEDSASEMKSSMHTGEASSAQPTGDGTPGKTASKPNFEDEAEESESDEDLPFVTKTRPSIAVIKNGMRELQGFRFGTKLTNLPLVGVDMDQVKTHIALMWRYRNHKETSVLIFSRLRGENEFDMVVDVVQSTDIYVRAESLYSQGYKMVGESNPLPIKTGRLLSFVIEGPLLVEKCEGGVPNSQGNPKWRTMYFSHSQINSIEFIVKRPQVEETKGPAGKKGKKKEEVKVDSEPDSRLEVMGFNAGSSTNGVDLANMPIWLTGPDLWQERHVHLRASDDKLLVLLIDCLKKSRALARNWWKLIILLGYNEKHVETEKGKTAPNIVVGMYLKKWFDDCLNLQDRGILRLIQALQTLELDIALDNVVRILKIYKANLLLEPNRPRYLKLLFHWVLQTKITRNNLLRATESQILRPVSDIFLLHLSNFLTEQDIFKIGAAMDVEENVLHAISGEEIITDPVYLAFRVLVKSRQKKDEIIHYTLLLMEMFKQVELPEAHEFMITETKKWMETVAATEYDICNKLENVFA